MLTDVSKENLCCECLFQGERLKGKLLEILSAKYLVHRNSGLISIPFEDMIKISKCEVV